LKKALPDYDLSTVRQENLPISPASTSKPCDSDPPEIVENPAQDLAVKAFLFLAVDAERARRFAAETGLSRDNLRAAAASNDILRGALDYLAGNESLLLAFIANCGIEPAEFESARDILSGQTES
jgi:Protein of unknown function (DUF3572)